MGGSGRAHPGLRERLACTRRPQGRRVRDPRAERPRLGAYGLRARARRRGRRPDLREQRAARRRVSPGALGGSRGRLRRRRPAREGRGGHGRAAEPPARAHVPRSPRARRARPRLRGGEPDRARRGVGGDRRGGPVHHHLHLGDDRAAEGLHAPPPQLLRDGERRRLDGGPLPRRRPDAPLSPARAQLRAADAPDRRLRGLPDRVPARPASRRRGDARGPPDRAPQRPPRVREGLFGRAGALRRGHGHEAAADRLGASDRT